MSNFNYDFIGINLRHLWSFNVSEDEKTALIGFGDDEGQLLQFDIEKKRVYRTYWTEGKYTSSIEFLSNSKAIIGTNNGFIMLIDLKQKEILSKNKISDKSIKELKLSSDGTMMFAITSNEVLAFEINSLTILFQKKLEFDPWDIVVATSEFIVIGGTNNKLELLDSKNFNMIDSISCGNENKDVSSLLYDKNSSLLISGTESGTLDMWQISKNGLIKDKEFKIGDNVYWLQRTNEYVAFSTSTMGIIFYLTHLTQEQKLLSVPNAFRESKFALKTINNQTHLLYQQKNRNLSLSNITKGEFDFFQLIDLPSNVEFLDLTSNGDIIAVASEGIIIANFMKKSNSHTTKYDFNSKLKNIAVEKFIFNELNDSIVLQCRDKTLKIISLHDANSIYDIDFPYDDSYGVEIKDFYQEMILLANYKNVYIINMQTKTTKEILNLDNASFQPIEKIKILNNKSYAIVNRADYRATPIIWNYLKKYDFDGNEIDSQKLGDITHSMFVSNNKLVTTSIGESSKIIYLDTNKIEKFEIGYCFNENDGTVLFDDEKYCIGIAIGRHFNYYMSCYDLTRKEDNGYARMIWEVEDPSLESFVPLGYCKSNQYFYIINKSSGDMISIDKLNGNIMKFYRLQDSLEDVQMSKSGKYIAWRLKTGEFSYISYPFQACEVTDE